MNQMVRRTDVARGPGATLRRVRLLGQPSLEDWLSFVSDNVVDGDTASVRALADEWRAANDHYYKLEKREAALAEKIERRPLDPSLAALTAALTVDPRFIASFEELPTRIEMVELDRLVVSQQSVGLDFAEELAARLPADPSPEQLFRFCHPAEPAQAPFEVVRLDANRYLFRSDSSDFRAHDPQLLKPWQVTGLATADPVAAIIGLAIGFGSNLLHAIAADGRLVLQNGYHRAYALRLAGIRHAPCIVQEVTRRDELRLVANEAVAEAPEFYFRAKRPPLLKDFFDPKLHRVLTVRRMSRLIEVNLTVREYPIVDAQ